MPAVQAARHTLPKSNPNPFIRGVRGDSQGGVCWGWRTPYTPLSGLFGYFLGRSFKYVFLRPYSKNTQQSSPGFGAGSPILYPSEIPKKMSLPLTPKPPHHKTIKNTPDYNTGGVLNNNTMTFALLSSLRSTRCSTPADPLSDGKAPLLRFHRKRR